MFKFCLLISFAVGLVLSGDVILPSLVNDLSDLTLEDFNSVLEHYDYTAVLFYSTFNCTACDRALEFHQNVSSDLINQYRMKRLYKNYVEFVYFATVDCDRNKHSTLSTIRVPHEETPDDALAAGRQLNDFSSKKVSTDDDQPVNELCNAYSVIDPPEWVLFRFGTSLKRLADVEQQSELYNLITENTRTVSIRFHSFARLVAFLKQSIEPVVIGLFEDIVDRLAIDSWLSSIEKAKLHWNYKEVAFCHIFANYSDGSLKQLQHYIRLNNQRESNFTLPMIVLVRQQHMIHRREKRFLIYKFGENKEDINQWIKRKIFGQILWRSRDNEEELKLPLVVAYFDFDFKNNLESSYKWRNWVYDLALRNADLSFALSNSVVFRAHLREYDLTVEDYEPLFIAYDLFGYGYKFDDLFSEFEFAEFLNDFRAGRLEPFVKKSSTVSEPQAGDQIIELSAKTFSKHVAHSNKDVFFLLYANWCSHCKDSVQAMKEIRAKIVQEDDLLLAQMECGDNEAPSKLDIEKYPAFFFFKSKEQSFVKFTGKNNLQSLINFIVLHSSKELLSFDEKGKLRTPIEQERLKNVLNRRVLDEMKIKKNLEQQTVGIKTEF